jgi:predicted ATPase
MPLTELTIENYGCIRSATIALTPLHAFIGPNDSGKSTILRAAETLGAAFGQVWRPDLQDALQGNVARGGTRIAALSSPFVSRVEAGPGDLFSSLAVREAGAERELGRYGIGTNGVVRPESEAVRGALLLRLDPDFLRLPATLLPDAVPMRFANDRGMGLPSVFDALVNRRVERFLAISEDVRRLFPFVKAVRMQNVNASTKAIAIELRDGQMVPASHVSEGLLYYLAFAVLPDVDPTALVLVEEPENGLHPARIADVVRVLREVSKTRQVLLATHSPLVVNELAPEEVSVVTRVEPMGTQATLIKDTPGFAERSEVYALGELWVSYANGENEAALLQGGPRP